jgi:hypothetical protein
MKIYRLEEHYAPSPDLWHISWHANLADARRALTHSLASGGAYLDAVEIDRGRAALAEVLSHAVSSRLVIESLPAVVSFEPIDRARPKVQRKPTPVA